MAAYKPVLGLGDGIKIKKYLGLLRIMLAGFVSDMADRIETSLLSFRHLLRV